MRLQQNAESPVSLLLYHFIHSSLQASADPVMMIRRLTSQVIHTHTSLYFTYSMFCNTVVTHCVGCTRLYLRFIT